MAASRIFIEMGGLSKMGHSDRADQCRADAFCVLPEGHTSQHSATRPGFPDPAFEPIAAITLLIARVDELERWRAAMEREMRGVS